MTGLVDSEEDASKFTDAQVKRRLGVAITHHNKLKEKLSNGFMALVPVVEKERGLKIESDIPIEDDDSLWCHGTFYFEKNTIKKMVVYSKYRNILRVPEGGKGKLERVVLKVEKKLGKVITDQS